MSKNLYFLAVTVAVVIAQIYAAPPENGLTSAVKGVADETKRVTEKGVKTAESAVTSLLAAPLELIQPIVDLSQEAVKNGEKVVGEIVGIVPENLARPSTQPKIE